MKKTFDTAVVIMSAYNIFFGLVAMIAGNDFSGVRIHSISASVLLILYVIDKNGNQKQQ